MSNLISRADVMQIVFRSPFFSDALMEEIMSLPTIESERKKRKKGKWVKENIVLTSNPPQYQWHCSECGRLVHWFTAEVLTNFCPNCGADMRGEEENLKNE